MRIGLCLAGIIFASCAVAAPPEAIVPPSGFPALTTETTHGFAAVNTNPVKPRSFEKINTAPAVDLPVIVKPGEIAPTLALPGPAAAVVPMPSSIKSPVHAALNKPVKVQTPEAQKPVAAAPEIKTAPAIPAPVEQVQVRYAALAHGPLPVLSWTTGELAKPAFSDRLSETELLNSNIAMLRDDQAEGPYAAHVAVLDSVPALEEMKQDEPAPRSSRPWWFSFAVLLLKSWKIGAVLLVATAGGAYWLMHRNAAPERSAAEPAKTKTKSSIRKNSIFSKLFTHGGTLSRA